jgi:2-amino-4-hydroxy-6-hydroxymethyldihydropteridine diphosphokinase
MPKTLAYLGLGSNLGDRMAALDEARALLEAGGFKTLARSSTWQTEPVGGPPQGPYLNEVLAGETTLSAPGLLDACLGVECLMGRVRAERFGPRTIDVDVLFYGDERRDAPGLVIPHPRLHERLFVLVPLAEIAPDLRHPGLGLTAAEMRARCPDTSAVRLYDRAEVGA